MRRCAVISASATTCATLRSNRRPRRKSEESAQCRLRIAKLQITAGLRLEGVTPAIADVLRPFDDKLYLHQSFNVTRPG